jgi:hypothetical protein
MFLCLIACIVGGKLTFNGVTKYHVIGIVLCYLGALFWSDLENYRIIKELRDVNEVLRNWNEILHR